MYGQILAGVIGGIGYSLVGWAQSYKHEGDEFDWIKFGKAVVIGALVGAGSGYSGQTYSVLFTGTLGVGVIKVVDVLWKAIVKRV